MQMNAYPLGHVFARLDGHGISELHVVLSSESGFRSALIIGTKKVLDTRDEAT
jgi:hypothetical protein